MDSEIKRPKRFDMNELEGLSAEEQISKLKEAVQRAKLIGDLYEEMLNVSLKGHSPKAP